MKSSKAALRRTWRLTTVTIPSHGTHTRSVDKSKNTNKSIYPALPYLCMYPALLGNPARQARNERYGGSGMWRLMREGGRRLKLSVRIGAPQCVHVCKCKCKRIVQTQTQTQPHHPYRNTELWTEAVRLISGSGAAAC